MIYTGICREKKELIMAYSLSSTVFCDEREMFEKIFDENCTIVMLTDSFVRSIIHWSTVDQVIEELMRIKRTCKFVIIGEDMEIDCPHAYMFKRSWANASQTLSYVENAVLTPLPKNKKHSNNVIDMLRFNLQTPDFLIDYILSNPELAIPELRRLLNVDAALKAETIALHSRLDTLVLENVKLQEEKEKLLEDLSRQQSETERLQAKHNALLAKINQQYHVAYDEDNIEGFNISVCRYDKILYIKELTRVHFVDSLLYYVQCILNTLNDKPTRFLVIEKEYSFSSTRLYPNHTPHNNLTYSELKTADICSIGFQKDIINSVLQNPSNAKYLIVLDRSGHDFLAIKGDRVRTLYTMSDLEDNKYFGAPPDITISYNTDTFYVPVIEDFDRMSDAERINAYSSLESTKALITTIEGKD